MALSFDQLRTRVAEFIGFDLKGTDGTGVSSLPTNAQDLDVVSRIVNDGYRRFLGERDWMFLRPIAELTFQTATTGSVETGGTGTFTDTARTEAAGAFAGNSIKITNATTGATAVHIVLDSTAAGVFTFADANLTFIAGDEYSLVALPAIKGEEHRYLMPADFEGQLLGRMTYAGPAGTPRMEITEVTEDEIRILNAGQTTTGGDPVLVAFRPLVQDDPSEDPRWEGVFWPSPSSNRTVVYKYQRNPPDLSLGTDRPIVGVKHERTLLSACKVEAEEQRFDKFGGAEAQKYAAQLKNSMRMDRDATPRSLGIMTEASDFQAGRPAITGTVDTVGGQNITF